MFTIARTTRRITRPLNTCVLCVRLWEHMSASANYFDAVIIWWLIWCVMTAAAVCFACIVSLGQAEALRDKELATRQAAQSKCPPTFDKSTQTVDPMKESS